MRPPKKPHPDFPLSAIGNGQWRKIVNGRPYYFGSWRDDPQGTHALQEWLDRKDQIIAGLEHATVAPLRSSPDGLTVGELVKQYLTLRSADVESGKLSPETFRDYTRELNAVSAYFGADATAKALGPSNFTAYMGKLEERKLGPHATKRAIASVKAAFKYAADSEWMPAISFGRTFSAPNTDSEAVSFHHLQNGDLDRTEIILTRKQVRRLLRAVKGDSTWYALVLLMLNTAMNPAEVARLKWSHINFKTGRLSRRRWKSKGIRQECYLWKRTRKALEAVPRTGEYVLMRKDGRLWVDSRAVMRDKIVVKTEKWNFITREFGEVVARAKLPGVTPYTLRRTARTLSAHCSDDNAAKRMMGQRLAGQDQTYVKRPFPLPRLKRIAMTIYARLLRPRVESGPKSA